MKMVLAQLGGSVWRALQQMSNATIIDEKGLNECLNEITRALLQADVQFKLVRDMQSNIKKTVNLDDLAAGHNKRTTCCCVYQYGSYCFGWGCCPLESATCCDDHSSGCPHEYPVCDIDGGTCLMDEETGAWYQHKGRDFKVVLIDNLPEDGNFVGAKKGLGTWPGALGQLSSMLLKSEGAHPKGEDSSESRYPNQKDKSLEGFYEEHSIVREVLISNSVTVSVRKCPEMAKNLLYMETDLPGDVVVHWGVCKDDGKKWEIPAEPYPAETIVFKNKALRTLLKEIEEVDTDEHYRPKSLIGIINVTLKEKV